MTETDLGLSGGGLPVGSTVALPGNFKESIVTQSYTLLRSGYVETDLSKFDNAYWDYTRATLWNLVHSSSSRAPTDIAMNAAGLTIMTLGAGGANNKGGYKVSRDFGVTWEAEFELADLNAGESMMAVTWVERLGIFILVGGRGLLYTTADGTTFTKRVTGTTQLLRAIGDNGAMLVVCGTSTIITSVDGQGWAARSWPGAGRDFYCIAWTGAFWFIGSLDTPGHLKSVNGVDYTLVSTGRGGNCTSVVFDGQKLVMTIPGIGILTTTDAVTFAANKVTPNKSMDLRITFSDGFYLLASNHAGLHKSTDLENWLAILGMTGNGVQTIRGVKKTQGRYYAWGADSSNSGRLLKGNELPYAGLPTEFYQNASGYFMSTVIYVVIKA